MDSLKNCILNYTITSKKYFYEFSNSIGYREDIDLL